MVPVWYNAQMSEVLIPVAVRRYAKGLKQPQKFLACWQLVMAGELTIAETAKKLNVVYGTAQRWMADARRLVKTEEDSPATLAEALTLVDVATLRAGLLEDSKRLPLEQRIKVQSALLADEQRRLGGDISKVESTSLTVALQLMPPAARSEELALRLNRMAARGTLPPSALALIGDSIEGAPSPPSPPCPPSQGPSSVHSKNSEIQTAEADFEEIEIDV